MCLFPQNKSRKKVAHLGLKEKSKKSPLDLIKMDKKWHKTFVRDKISANFFEFWGNKHIAALHVLTCMYICSVYSIFVFKVYIYVLFLSRKSER